MNSTEITNLSEKELELLFAQKELARKFPQVEEKEEETVNFWDAVEADENGLGDFSELLDLDLDKANEHMNLLNRIEELEKEVAAEKEAVRVAGVQAEIEKLNELIKKEWAKIGTFKDTSAGKRFYNSRTHRWEFMTFTQINVAKVHNAIKRLRWEIKDLKETI